MSSNCHSAIRSQKERNEKLIESSLYMKDSVKSKAIPFTLDISKPSLSDEQALTLEALGIDAARTAVKSLASLSKIGELDHLGGGLDLIPALCMTLAFTDYEKKEYTIEHAHTSIGYYSSLASFGFLDKSCVIDGFRRGIDIPGHVSWVPGGTQLNGGRLGIMVPVAVGQALGKKARHPKDAWVITHMGDAGWISGQALNGFNAADLHSAPMTFIMHRNGLQLSGSNHVVMDKDPRPIIASMGIEIIEIESIHNTKELYKAYHEAYKLASQGKPNMIYPTGQGSLRDKKVTLQGFAEELGISSELESFASSQKVSLDTKVWVPGALMSYRDTKSMLECIFLVNDLPGGVDHHDGHMKGRDEAEVLAGSMLSLSDEHKAVLEKLRSAAPREVLTQARPAVGSKNLVLSDSDVSGIELPAVGKSVSARAGIEAAYAKVAEVHADKVYIVSCDLDPSTKLGKARKFLAEDHQFEVSIEEQLATLMVSGLGMASHGPSLNVVSTFAAFFEGIAREGFELWRYQRNLNGKNEGINAVMHMSHVGACTGRDHFSGWALDWITLGLGYLPYIDRFYTPSDARSAFIAVRDLSARYGGHIIGVPRDNLPILSKEDGSALWENTSEFEAVTEFRNTAGAKTLIIAVGATAFIAEEAATVLNKKGVPTDVHVVNGFPLNDNYLEDLSKNYKKVVSVEDGIIATPKQGLRGFAGMLLSGTDGLALGHVGITDPTIAPADGHMEIWEHFGITAEAIVEAATAE